MGKRIVSFKVRSFNVETTFDDVVLSCECHFVGNTLTVTITKPFVGVYTLAHMPYIKGSLRKEMAKELALDELERVYLDFIIIAADYETYRDVVYKQMHYLAELERKRGTLKATIESVKRQYVSGKINSDEELKSCQAINNAFSMIDFDAMCNFELLVSKHKLTKISFEYTKQIILWMLNNEEEARKMIDAHNKQQAALRAWINSDTEVTREEWLNRHKEKMRVVNIFCD